MLRPRNTVPSARASRAGVKIGNSDGGLLRGAGRVIVWLKCDDRRSEESAAIDYLLALVRGQRCSPERLTMR